ncbi:MAG: universal stress protein [Desulfotalea sp.]
MIKRILVPVAFSQHSYGMVHFAADLALATGAELLIVNVISNKSIEAVEKITSYGYKVDKEKYIETIKNERRENIAKLTEELTLPDDQVTFTFRLGDPSAELIKLILEKEVDMIVMGVKTRDFKTVFTGSVAQRIFRRCPVTVVSYRDDVSAAKLRKRAKKLIKKN